MARDSLWIANHEPPLPLIHADYQRCLTFENGPILNSHDGHYDRVQPGEKHPDGGIS